MFSFFNKAKPTKVTGSIVTINEGDKTPEQRLNRANNRVENLKHKVHRLQERKQTKDIKRAILETQKACTEWEKRARIAAFEIAVNRGEV